MSKKYKAYVVSHTTNFKGEHAFRDGQMSVVIARSKHEAVNAAVTRLCVSKKKTAVQAGVIAEKLPMIAARGEMITQFRPGLIVSALNASEASRDVSSLGDGIKEMLEKLEEELDND